MKITIEMEDEKIKKYLGKELTQEEFEKFCHEAITEKIFTNQFIEFMPQDPPRSKK